MIDYCYCTKCYGRLKTGKVGKCYVSTCPVFAGPVTLVHVTSIQNTYTHLALNYQYIGLTFHHQLML